MPCRDDYPPEYRTANDVQNAENRVRSELEPLLCEACGLLEESRDMKTGKLKMSKELAAWYSKHEIKERARVRVEAARKLSEKERRALGIDLQALIKELRQ